MEFTHKKKYMPNKIIESYFIEEKEVDQYTYEMLDNDQFDKFRNTKIKDGKKLLKRQLWL